MNYTSLNFSGESDSDNILIDEVSRFIGESILTGMLLEVTSYPKPGLVTSMSQGSHQDMNILTFMVSSGVISSSFPIFAQAGRLYSGSPGALLPTIRNIGVGYEKKLLKSTDNINTQRGILFAGGIFAASAGYSYSRLGSHDQDSIFRTVADMTDGLCSRELDASLLSCKTNRTAGEKLYLEYGVTGIRGEVECGFPSVRDHGLPAFNEAIDNNLRLNDCLVHALISLMACVEDSTVLWRGGVNGLEKVKTGAAAVLEKGSVFTGEGRAQIEKLDSKLIEERLSPGGSADLLTITVSSYLLKNRFFPVIRM